MLPSFPSAASAQILMSGGNYSQNFDSLGISDTGNPWTNNVTLPGWYASKSVAPNGITNYNAARVLLSSRRVADQRAMPKTCNSGQDFLLWNSAVTT